MGKRRKMSKTYYLRQIVACLLVYCILLAVPAQVVLANPDPPDGAHPSTLDYNSLTGTAITVGNTTIITAPSNGTVFDWENFDIGFGHTVDHLMEPTHAVLHRINVTSRGDNGDMWGDGAATGINGNLNAPGYLFVVNPMGIVIGPKAFIEAQRFVASGLDISNFDEFIADPATTKELQFDGYDPATLGVQLMAGGEIDASAVALVGKTVINNGTITSGSVVLAAGERVYLAVTEGSGNLVVDVTQLSTPTPIADHSVYNAGTIDATDGNVLLAAGDIYSNAISGVENLAAKANRDIMLFDNIQAGEIGMDAGRDIILSVDKTMDSDGMLTLLADGAISLLGRVEAGGAGDVSLTTTISGDVTVTDVRALDDQITINSGGAILEYPSGGDSGADLTAATLSLTAKAGITGQSPIETSATNITASTEAGDIDIDNNSSGSATTASLAVTTGTGTILFSQAGGGSLDVTSATTANGSIEIDVDNANLTARTVTAVNDNVSLTTTTSGDVIGDVIVDNITAADNTITINSAGAILEYAGGDSGADLTAATLLLSADTGIKGQSPIETSATDITASTEAGDIDIDNTNVSATTASLAVTMGAGNILFSQADGGSLDVASATTANGSIGIDVDDASLTAQTVTAVNDNVSLTTTATKTDPLINRDVIVNNITATGTGNQITIISEGAILEDVDDPDVDLTADTLDLTAKSRIVAGPLTGTIETAANIIFARTIVPALTGAYIQLDNYNSSPTSLTASTVGTASHIYFDQMDGGELTLTNVSTDDGSIDIDAYSGNIVAEQVDAGDAGSQIYGNVWLRTHDSGDITVGSVKADEYIWMSSAGSINDATDDHDYINVDIETPVLDLDARDEIGGSPIDGKMNDTIGAIETDVGQLSAWSWGTDVGEGGDIVIVEKDDVELLDVVAESGSIFLEATNGGMTHPGGTIKAGGSTLTLVQKNDLDLADFWFENQENTDLMVKATDGWIIADDWAPENAADQWQSIQAIATDNIVLQGSDPEEDIKIGLHEGYDPISHPFGGGVASWGGGVSIISENGAVRTADDTILDDVEIWGVSDDELDIGVDLPYGPGKAAIVIMSEDTLTLGENAELTASGWYDATGDVDDREGVGLLDVRDEIPEGYPRYEGGPFDAAIYLASTGGDVEVSSPVSITSYEKDGLNGDLREDQEYPPSNPSHVGAMIIDAFDSVTFGELFEESLAGEDGVSFVGNRLEVASRITEWLFQAAGRLPYSGYPYYGGGPFPLDYTYVLRGAGLENPVIANITEGLGRAWVLVDPDNAPLDREAGEQAQRLTLGLDGCPVLLAAVSAELGIPEETIEVSMENSYALNTDIQPCESCARLIDAAAILRDEDGSRMAAMNQVFNELAPSDAPLTPEVMASIVTAFAGHINDGTQYATAIEYIDAFVQYIAVLNSDIGSPVGDSVAYVMEKYGSGVTGTDNANLAAFVAARLESGEMFGN